MSLTFLTDLLYTYFLTTSLSTASLNIFKQVGTDFNSLTSGLPILLLNCLKHLVLLLIYQRIVYKYLLLS